MSAQLLIYETVVPLSLARHRNAAVQIGENYTFSKNTNSVPLMAVEFPYAASEYAIVFAGNKESVMPAAILGVRDRENLYISSDAKWDAKYIPAFVRRYPFVFTNSDNGQRFVLCVDEAFSGFNHEGKGQKIFGEDGKPTEFVDKILKFLQEYQTQFSRTQAFCKKVLELDLLEPMQAQVETNSGEKLSLSGFMAVNRTKLKAVAPEKLAELARTDELELLYLHLQSMRNFMALPGRLAVIEGEAGAASANGADPAAEPEKDGKPSASRVRA